MRWSDRKPDGGSEVNCARAVLMSAEFIVGKKVRDFDEKGR